MHHLHGSALHPEGMPSEEYSDNSDYPNIEFVVLDYNTTKEPIQRWMLENMHEEIEQGKVAYYRTEEPRFYSMTHSRNMAFRLATGDLVNNVDADNFTGKGFASFLNFMANECPERRFSPRVKN